MESVQKETVSELEIIFENIACGIIYEQNGTEYRREEIIGKPTRQIKKLLTDSSDAPSDHSCKSYCLRKKNGQNFWATIKINSFTPKEGVYARVWYIEDVTRRRESNIKIQQMSKAVEQSSNSIIITDINGFIHYANPAFVKTTGYDLQEVIGKKPSLLKSGKTPPHLFTEMWESITSGKEWSGRFVNKKKNGEIYQEHVVVAPIRDEQGDISHFIATKENITEFRNALKEAERANRAKGEFLAYMSHEIRTPLNVIIGMTSMVLESELENNQKIFLQRVKSSADSLLALVNDLLDYSKIEAGKLSIEHYPFSLHELVQDIEDAMSFLATKKGIKFFVATSAITDLYAIGDRMRLHQILYNLIGNAIKFTPKGKVKLKVESCENETDSHIITFQIRDTGIGIDPENLKTIFDNFVQAEAQITRNFGGTGLGLSISNQLVRLMGGKLVVKSVPGLGSQFSFTLTLPKASASDIEKSSEKKENIRCTKKLKILLVEDNIGNQELASAILQKAGHQVIIADNGVKALDRLASSGPFDAVFMDMQMPEMDGLTTISCIRKVEKGFKTDLEECTQLEKDLSNRLAKGHLYIVAMTANAMLSEQKRCREAGADSFLAKPYSRQNLLAQLPMTGGPASEKNYHEASRHVHHIDKPSSEANYDTCLQYLQENFNLNTSSATDVLNSFIDSLKESLENLDEAVKAAERKEIQALAHKIKGGLFNIHCDRQGNIAKEIESSSLTGELAKIELLTVEIKKGLAPVLEKERPSAM